jgi:hypothetical protein
LLETEEEIVIGRMLAWDFCSALPNVAANLRPSSCRLDILARLDYVSHLILEFGYCLAVLDYPPQLGHSVLVAVQFSSLTLSPSLHLVLLLRAILHPCASFSPISGYLDVEVAAGFSPWPPRFSVFCYAFGFKQPFRMCPIASVSRSCPLPLNLCVVSSCPVKPPAHAASRIVPVTPPN